ncbi:hypothetical protein H0I23_06330 [Cellulophaga sp. HaHaR_3_176]|uniref:AAA domain-containing protein n=1 Tax=Cellulophaga sp. HaHaR_3_176 TaxID=1942464 RepID=UPI001C1F8C97|nr:AAA domain-containing protein [Cellulophaga sp. HaHaR_3_176]QWX85252.1 hypothetical protein H0I23_06330 [Cellulophaga sp. HaHaR_3_176]
MKETSKWLNYYRASLIDGNRGDKKPLTRNFIERNTSMISNFNEAEIKSFWKDFKKDEKTLFNDIEIAPFYIASEVKHGSNKRDSKKHFPFWIKARVNKEGILSPPKESKPPEFLRVFLSPNPGNYPTITSIEKLDRSIAKTEISIENWEQYWEDCERFFYKVTNRKFKEYHEEDIYQFAIAENSDDSVIQNILQLYNALTDKKNKSEYPLLNNVLEVEPEVKNHELTEEEIFLNPYHCGQMSGEYPLSESQRVAFAQFSSKYNKKAFAVNGPPGTGKTFILQSFIANIVSKSVLNSAEAPLIMGSSTNNQAITNILDSMTLDGGDTLNSRWIPDVNSFGLYLCSKAKAETGKYQSATSKYLNDFFLEKLEDYSKIDEYKKFFLKQLRTQFRTETIDKDTDVKAFLLKRIKALKTTIHETISIAIKKHKIPELLIDKYYKSTEELISKTAQLKDKLIKNSNKEEQLKSILNQLEEKNANFPMLIRLLPLRKFQEIKTNSFKLIAHPFINEFIDFNDWSIYLKVYSRLEEVLLNTIKQQENLQYNLDELLLLVKEIKTRNSLYENFKSKWSDTYSKKWVKLIKKTNDEYNNLDTLRDTAVKLDISYRYELFWLSTHYREWEYIEELENKKENEEKYKKENKELGEKSYAKKLRRIAKISPLYIATFHSLPKFLTYYNHKEGQKYYKELFDLMIVDESGQVSPEVAIPSLSLTKKILAVGDVHQIEPVWNVTENIDFFNAKKYDVIKSEDEFERNASLGFNASNGNLMRIIRNATPFIYKHQNNKLEKGAYLLEHRRCLDPIAEYSKDNIYSGSLKLMGGKSNDTYEIPPLGYIHVNGSSEKHNGSSKKNVKEANAIVQWIISKREEIETAYGKPIDEVLAVVTPFSAQKTIIKGILKNQLGEEISEKIIVGTVHALQGTERAIILFSSVHGIEDTSLFFDFEGKFNMLNVALTRAKHSFIVIGNMGVFNPKDKTPSGRLAEKLLSSESYALDERFIFKSELVYQNTPQNKVTRIDDLDMHRKLLKRCFDSVEKELIIFSPFLSINAIKEDNIISLIKECTTKNIKITIVTDNNLDKKDGQLKRHSKLGREAISETKAELVIVNGIHNKTICIDNKVLIEGSFNWLSATRDSSSPYHRNETSIIIQGDMVENEISKIKDKFSI